MTRPSDAAGIGLALLLAGLGLCCAKWAGWAALAEWSWWEVALAPAGALAFEAAVVAVWFVTAGKVPKT